MYANLSDVMNIKVACGLICSLALTLFFGCQASVEESNSIFDVTVDSLFSIHTVNGEEFGVLRDLKLGEDGTLFLSDPGLHQVHKFTPDGEWIDSVGREGEGPGEFNRLGLIQVIGDTLFVPEASQRAVHVFSAVDLTFKETVRLSTGLFSPGNAHLTPIGEEYLYLGGISFSTNDVLVRTDRRFQDAQPVLMHYIASNPIWALTHAVSLPTDALFVAYRFLPFVEVVQGTTVTASGPLHGVTVDDEDAQLSVERDGYIRVAQGVPSTPVTYDLAATQEGLVFVVLRTEGGARTVQLYDGAAQYRGEFNLPASAAGIAVHENRLYTIGGDRLHVQVYEFQITERL